MTESGPGTQAFSNMRTVTGPSTIEPASTVAHFLPVEHPCRDHTRFDLIGVDPPRRAILEGEMWDRLKMPKNFMAYTLSLPHQLSERRMDEIQDLLDQESEWDALRSLASYQSVVRILFGVLSDAPMARDPQNNHAIALNVVARISQDVSAIHEEFIDILQHGETYKSFLGCRGPIAQQLLDLLQDVLDSFPESSARPLLSKALLRLSHVSGLHPSCFALSGLQKVGQQVAAGAFGDIWKGLVRGQSVSVKIMRLFRDADVKAALQEFGREALIWRQLSHPNLLPFFGLYYLDSRLCLVSPWMSNGHVLEFLQNAPPDTDRLSLILDIAMGLEYLHRKHVVHGDLKGMNILVTPSHRACLADFGLSTIADAMTLRFTHSTSASARGGTARYQAPELIATDNPNHYESDVYAFACVCYEIITGKAPFFEFPRDVTVSIKVLEGLRPSRPDTVPVDALWVLLEDCWEKKPIRRPDVRGIIQRLTSPVIGARTTQSATDWDEKFSSKVRRSLQDWPLLPSVKRVERRISGDEIAEACLECFPPPEESTAPRTEAPKPAATISPFPFAYTGYVSRASSPILSLATEYDCIPAQRASSPPPGSYRRVTVPISCLSADHYVPISADGRSAQMCDVFVSTHDLEVHHGGPPDFPLLPPLRIHPQEATQESDVDLCSSSRQLTVGAAPSLSSSPRLRAFNSLLESYQTMLAQKPTEAGDVHAPLPGVDERPVRGLLETLELPGFGNEFGALPLLGGPEADRNPFLTSPLEPSYDADDFATPPDDTPFSTFLATPLLADDLDFGDYGCDSSQSLFGGVSTPPLRASPSPRRFALSRERAVSRKSTSGSTAVGDDWVTPLDGYDKTSDSAETPMGGRKVARGEESMKRSLGDQADDHWDTKRKRIGA